FADAILGESGHGASCAENASRLTAGTYKCLTKCRRGGLGGAVVAACARAVAGGAVLPRPGLLPRPVGHGARCGEPGGIRPGAGAGSPANGPWPRSRPTGRLRPLVIDGVVCDRWSGRTAPTVPVPGRALTAGSGSPR